MYAYQLKFVGKPSIRQERCVICGAPAREQHHIVPRSQGGKDLPTISVCGWGNATGCHGLFHAHLLHIRWNDQTGWYEWLRTPKPVKDSDAWEMEGWVPLRVTPPAY